MIKKIKDIINNNKNKLESPIRYARRIGVKLGKNIFLSTKHFSTEPYLITIGDNCRIAKDVKFFTHGGCWSIRFIYNDMDLDYFGKIEIGNNTYIGESSMILPGISIGDNCIIGAGSVITKSVPNNKFVAGNPARILGLTDDVYKKMKRFDLKTKNLSPMEKKDYLLCLDDSKFIKKDYLK